VSGALVPLTSLIGSQLSSRSKPQKSDLSRQCDSGNGMALTIERWRINAGLFLLANPTLAFQ
jgi:hypothetical protein